MKNPFKNKNSLSNNSESRSNSKLIDKAGSLALEGAPFHVEDDGRRVVDDINILAFELAQKGFTTSSFGRGPWIDGKDARVIDELAIKHPDGTAVTISTYKFYTQSGSTLRSLPYLEDRTPQAYQEHIAEWQIKLSPDAPLADLSTPPSPEA